MHRDKASGSGARSLSGRFERAGNAAPGAVLLLASAALPLVLLVPHIASGSVSSGAVKCRYEADAHVLSVTAAERGGIDGEAVLRRVGDELRVSEFLGSPVSCHGTPSIANTDRVKIRAKGISSVDVDLGGGPFAPGATPEADSSSEIEFAVSGDGIIDFHGTPGADHFRFMGGREGSGLNLNPGSGDDDADVFLRNPEGLFVASGGPGSDKIDVVGRPRAFVFADGGGGSDELLAARGVGLHGGRLYGISFEGGAGDDRLVGTRSYDLLDPGNGSDVVKAGGGSDEITMWPDKSRDKVNCGPGRDRVHRFLSKGPPVDPFDRLRSCERIGPRKRR